MPSARRLKALAERMAGFGIVRDALFEGRGVHGVVHELGFDLRETAQAPDGGGHIEDEAGFDLVGGAETVHVLVQMAFENGLGFSGENDLAGEQSVPDCVQGRALPALLRFVAAAQGAVGA